MRRYAPSVPVGHPGGWALPRTGNFGIPDETVRQQELLETICRVLQKPAKATPDFLVTRHTFRDQERCFAAGMNGYVSKPISTNQLFATIESLMTKQAETAGSRRVGSRVPG